MKNLFFQRGNSFLLNSFYVESGKQGRNEIKVILKECIHSFLEMIQCSVSELLRDVLYELIKASLSMGRIQRESQRERQID